MRKIKVNINRPQASPEQVAGQQQFDQMLSMYKKAKYLFYAKVVAVVTSVLVVAAVAGYLFIANSENVHGNTNSVNKLSPNDPYASTMVESQFFELDASKDTVVEGENGTVIAIPAGAFLDEDGNVFSGNVKLEIAESYTAADLIGGNITTDKNYGIQKALFIKATGDGKELNYSADKPVIAEVPVSTTTEQQVILDGTRNDQGEMSWTQREPVKKYLVTLPLAQLDFLPKGFEEEVQWHMPYRGREVADKALVDSLYYSINTYKSYAAPISADYVDEETDYDELGHPRHEGIRKERMKCIDPSSIKAIKEPAYENTFIATREFEQRLKAIFTTCDQSVLKVYIDHLHENLWISDSLAAEKLGRDSEAGKKFLAWSRLRCTNVKDAPETSSLLRQHYEMRQKKIEQQLQEERTKYQKQLVKEDQHAEKVRQNYSKLLEERYKYRLEKFGIPVRKNGTIAVATILAQLPKFEMKVIVEGGAEYDHVHVYVINPIDKSIFAMTSGNKVLFDGAYAEDPNLLLWVGQKATVIAVGYKDDKIFAAQQSFTQQDMVDIKITPVAVSIQEYRAMIAVNNSGYTRENKIELDLAYQKKFYQEKLRQERLSREYEMMVALIEIACPCSFKGNCAEGQQLFMDNCKSCHRLSEKSVGPPLAGISQRRSYTWIKRMILNPQELIKSGDPEAVALYHEYGESEMTRFPTFKDEDIDALLCYLNSGNVIKGDSTK